MTVLFVDGDSDECADYVSAVLRRGWQAEVAANAESALAIIETDPPDVLVTDADLGGAFDGFELARRIKTDLATRHLPVIVLTDLPLGEWGGERVAAGCSACVTKPCDVDSLMAAVNGALTIARILARRRADRDPSLCGVGGLRA